MMDNIKLKTDDRFTYSFRLHNSSASSTEPLQLLVAIHGNKRDVEGLCNTYMQNIGKLPPGNYVLLFPLFPIGVLGDGSDKGYKYLREKEIRYDNLLFDMIHQLCQNNLHLAHDIPTFLLYGYSGGGQFVHRFFYLYPERVRALFVGAPGAVTFISHEHNWWFGTRNIKKTFGLHGDLDLDAMKRVPIQMIVGDKDTEEVMYSKPVMEKLAAAAGGEDALLAVMGRNRVQRMQLLCENWKKSGLNVKLQVVPGLGHDGNAVVPNALDFFASAI